jgi:RND superfamily putative drug exporter
VIAVVAAGGLLVALAVPALGMKTADTGIQGLPQNLAATKTLNRIQAAFPGGSTPAQVVIQAPDVRSPAVSAAIDRLSSRALASGQMKEPIAVERSRSGRVAVVDVPLVGSGTDARSDRALETLRSRVIPATVGQLDGVRASVTGMTAQSKDYNDSVASHAPLVFAFVLAMAFVLLLVRFRSIVIPLKAIVLNLLSVGAAYGVLVLVFQNGWGESLLGFSSTGAVTSWLPMFLFVILFGLSMDYHVFILSRVREAFDRGLSTEAAVADGIKRTAGVVTSAAAVMVAVFSIFATLGALDFKQLGVGLAAAILIDATIVRAVLLPAAMKLLGDWNWYLPSWLGWLPRTTTEPVGDAAKA